MKALFLLMVWCVAAMVSVQLVIEFGWWAAVLNIAIAACVVYGVPALINLRDAFVVREIRKNRR